MLKEIRKPDRERCSPNFEGHTFFGTTLYGGKKCFGPPSRNGVRALLASEDPRWCTRYLLLKTDTDTSKSAVVYVIILIFLDDDVDLGDATTHEAGVGAVDIMYICKTCAT